MKKKIIIMLFVMIAFAIGTIIGQTICFFIFPREPLTNHVCTCEYCKLTRQLEAIEVVDSVIHDRIVINIEREDEK